jgi:hypothetical protein
MATANAISAAALLKSVAVAGAASAAWVDWLKASPPPHARVDRQAMTGQRPTFWMREVIVKGVPGVERAILVEAHRLRARET